MFSTFFIFFKPSKISSKFHPLTLCSRPNIEFDRTYWQSGTFIKKYKIALPDNPIQPPSHFLRGYTLNKSHTYYDKLLALIQQKQQASCDKTATTNDVKNIELVRLYGKEADLKASEHPEKLPSFILVATVKLIDGVSTIVLDAYQPPNMKMELSNQRVNQFLQNSIPFTATATDHLLPPPPSICSLS